MLQPISTSDAGPRSRSCSAELFGVVVVTQVFVDVTNVALEDVFEWRPKVAVEPGIDDRVQ